MAFFDDINDDSPKAGQSSNKENSSANNHSDRVKDEPPHSSDNLGEAPEFPPIFFTYDPIKNKFQVRDKRGNVKSEFDVMTVNGADAYHLWKDGQAAGSDTSYTAYQKDIKGQDGKNGKNAFEEWQDSRDPNTDRSWEAYLKFFKGDNGKSAFEQWKEVHGEYTNPDIDDFFNYFKGQDGKDAYEVWRDMGFNGDKQAFFEWLAGLVKAKPGKDGKTYYPHFDGYELYFTEDPEGKGPVIEKQNVRGETGRTYKPHMEGTKLHFDDEEGDSTDPVELKGKDAFELWKEYHHKPDAKYEEFEDFFKGQNVKSDHSYLDIKDFTCPVQTIDTELIVNVLDSAKSPDELIKIRQEDIDNLRKEGESLTYGLKRKTKCQKLFPISFLLGSTIYKNWAGWFKEFSWWCAGADRPLLRMCKGDHSKYTGIGTVILFTALMAWFSSYMAMRLVFQVPEKVSLLSIEGGNLAAISFASFWAMLIFFLDRFITNTMYSDGKVIISKDEIIGGLPRILISIFLGIVISAPLELRIFSDEIENYLKKDLLNQYTTQEINTSDKLSFANEQVNRARHDYDLARQNFEYFQALKADTTYKQYYETKRITTSQTNGTTTDGVDINGNPTKSYGGGSSTYNVVPDYDKKKLKLWKGDSINSKIALDQAEKTFLLSKDSVLIVKDYLKNSFDLDSAFQKKGLYDHLEAMHKIALNSGKPNAFKPRNSLTDPIRIVCSAIILFLIIFITWFNSKDWNRKTCMLTVVTALLIGGLTYLCFNLLYELGYFLFTPIGLIMLLFILIDISPVLYKMMLADGVYDNYLHQEKLLAQDKIRLSLARMLRNIEKGELKALSPFIMGKIYRKLMKFSTNASGKYGTEEKDYKQHIKWGDTQGLNEDIKIANDDVFRIVLNYKKRIVLASYAAWYRDMRDAMIGAKDDAEGNKIRPQTHLYGKNEQTEDKETTNTASSGNAQPTQEDSKKSENDDNGNDE